MMTFLDIWGIDDRLPNVSFRANLLADLLFLIGNDLNLFLGISNVSFELT
jgi:hypothetical protein